MKKAKKILVAPLDWGLGHATRLIPIIRYLKESDCEIIIAASGNGAQILREYFPEVKLIALEGYKVQYGKRFFQWHIILQIPKILRAIKHEHQWLQKIIDEYRIDAVISDNRYGLHSQKIPSVLITHQLNIQTPGLLQSGTVKTVDNYINKFTECWVPDFKGKNSLAGQLSQRFGYSKKIKHIGPLSRLNFQNEKIGVVYDYLGIVSGPEKQRTIFQNALVEALVRTGKKSLILCGLPQENFKKQKDNVTMVSHLDSQNLIQAVTSSKTIICRSGYSTIMDLIALQRGAIIVPTPGQTEQEYLANHLDGKFGFCQLQQKKLLKITAFPEITDSSNVVLPVNDMKPVSDFLNKYLPQ